jgi:hypothetical protein
MSITVYVMNVAIEKCASSGVTKEGKTHSILDKGP